MRNELAGRNVATEQSVPKIPDDEMPIVRDVPALVDKLRTWRLGTAAMIALFTGMRLSEILALRWGRIDLDRNTIKVREALERTDAYGVRFKAPKSRAGRRDISLPDNLVEVLRQYRRDQLELRLKLGAGRLTDDGLLFAESRATRYRQMPYRPRGQTSIPK